MKCSPPKGIIIYLLIKLFAFSLNAQIPEPTKATQPADTLTIDEVVVSGTRTEVSKRNVPVSITLIDRVTIENSNETAILSLVSQRTPGLFITERGVTGFGIGTGSSGQISIRGVGGTSPNNQVLVLIDGHPQTASLFGHPLPDAYASSDVERVEVIRGPASVIYGSNAMVGAVNLITRKHDQDGFMGRASVQYGAYNTQKYMGSGGYKQNGFTVLASINHDRTDGHRDTMAFKLVNGFVKTEYEINNNLSVGADLNLAQYDSEDPGTIYAPQFFGIDILRGKTSLWVRNRFENTQGGITAYYNFGQHSFSNGWKSDDFSRGVNLYQSFQPIANNSITLGVDYKDLGGIASSGVRANEWIFMDETAGYAMVQHTFIERFIVSGGLRYEHNNLYGGEIIPHAGLSVLASQTTTLKGSVSKGFRSPTLMEIYLYAPNPDLRPERMLSYEAGIAQWLIYGRLRAEVTGFIAEGSNIIEVRPNQSPPPPMQRQNVGSFSNYGVESEVNWYISQQLSVNANYSYTETDQPRLATPKHQAFAEGSYAFGQFRLSTSIQGISHLYTSIGEDGNTKEEFILLNARLSYRPNRMVELMVWGKNLLNQDYSIMDGYPMPGITVFGGVNLKFN